MTQNPNDQMPLMPKPSLKPSGVASTVGNYIKAFVALVFWLIVAAATLALAYVALRGIWWAVKLTTDALGI